MDESRLHAQRMRELADAGDYAGALSAYVELEARLQAELKVAPVARDAAAARRDPSRSAPPPLGTGGRRLRLRPRAARAAPHAVDLDRLQRARARVVLEHDHGRAERLELADALDVLLRVRGDDRVSV